MFSSLEVASCCCHIHRFNVNTDPTDVARLWLRVIIDEPSFSMLVLMSWTAADHRKRFCVDRHLKRQTYKFRNAFFGVSNFIIVVGGILEILFPKFQLILPISNLGFVSRKIPRLQCIQTPQFKFGSDTMTQDCKRSINWIIMSSFLIKFAL